MLLAMSIFHGILVVMFIKLLVFLAQYLIYKTAFKSSKKNRPIKIIKRTWSKTDKIIMIVFLVMLAFQFSILYFNVSGGI